MATDIEPTVGQWYYDAEKGRWLEVVDVDIDEELVVVQSQEGEEDELSLDSWYAMDVEPGEPPDEDWLEDDADPDVLSDDEDEDESLGGDLKEAGDYRQRNQSDWARRSPDDIYPNEEEDEG